MDYVENDEITVLNCSDKHYFHRECMINNIKAGNFECPLCRADITECMMMDEHIYEARMMAAEDQPLMAEEEQHMMAGDEDVKDEAMEAM